MTTDHLSLTDRTTIKGYLGAPRDICLADEVFRSGRLFWTLPCQTWYRFHGSTVVRLDWTEAGILSEVFIFDGAEAEQEFLKWGYLMPVHVKEMITRQFDLGRNLFEVVLNSFGSRFLALTHQETSVISSKNEFIHRFTAGGTLIVNSDYQFRIVSHSILEGPNAFQDSLAVKLLPNAGYSATPKVHSAKSLLEVLGQLNSKEQVVRFRIDQRFDPMRIWFELAGTSTPSYYLSTVQNLIGS